MLWFCGHYEPMLLITSTPTTEKCSCVGKHKPGKTLSIHTHIREVTEIIYMQFALAQGWWLTPYFWSLLTAQEICVAMHQCGLGPQDLLCPNTQCSCSNWRGRIEVCTLNSIIQGFLFSEYLLKELTKESAKRKNKGNHSNKLTSTDPPIRTYCFLW